MYFHFKSKVKDLVHSTPMPLTYAILLTYICPYPNLGIVVTVENMFLVNLNLDGYQSQEGVVGHSD
jgi:hypothetical protein